MHLHKRKECNFIDNFLCVICLGETKWAIPRGLHRHFRQRYNRDEFALPFMCLEFACFSGNLGQP